MQRTVQSARESRERRSGGRELEREAEKGLALCGLYDLASGPKTWTLDLDLWPSRMDAIINIVCTSLMKGQS